MTDSRVTAIIVAGSGQTMFSQGATLEISNGRHSVSYQKKEE